jgi:hypothetical protein
MKKQLNEEFKRMQELAGIKETKEVYGKQYLVNLIDKKGSQKRIGD